MRARMALYRAGIQCEIVEVDLKAKPATMLALSAKGSVPVLQLPSGQVIDESLDIMQWALERNDPGAWWGLSRKAEALIVENDSRFKRALDRYKYPQRYPGEDCTNAREEALVFLQTLDALLVQQRYLSGETLRYADIAIFPFVRQFANVDAAWFETRPLYGLQKWLNARVNSPLFLAIMQKSRVLLL